MILDCYVRNVTPAQMENVYTQYRAQFLFLPVPLYIPDDENGIELLGYHIKVKHPFYLAAKAEYPARIYLYQDLPAKYKIGGQYPLHIFGSGEGIDTASDTEDQAKFMRFLARRWWALSHDRRKAFKISEAGELVELTAQEIEDEGIVLEGSQ